MNDAPPSHPPAAPDTGKDHPPDTQNWEQLQSHLAQVQHVVDACSQQLTGFAHEREAARIQKEKLEQRQAEVEGWRARLETEQEDLEHRGREIGRQREELDRDRRDFDDRAAQLQQERDRLEADRQTLHGSQAELKNRREELDALESDLDEQRANLDDRFEQLETAQADLREQRESLDERAKRIDEQRRQFDEHTQRTIAELRRREQQHEAELEEKQGRLNEQNERKAAELREREETLQAELDRKQKKVDEQYERAAVRLREQEHHLRAEYDKKHERLDEQAGRAAADLDRRAGELDRRTAEYDRADEELNQSRRAVEIRRDRIGRCKAAVRDRADSVRRKAAELESVREAARQVMAQRQSLVEVQQLLGDAEERMIDKWAVRRGIGWVFGILVCVSLLLMMSYAVADQLATRRWVASAAAQYRGPGVSDSPEWIERQRQLMLDDAVLKQTAVMMRQSNYAGPAEPGYLRELLEAGLHIAAPQAGLLHIELHGTEKDALAPLLRGLTRAYAAEASRRGPDAEASATIRITQDAALAPTPIDDNHLILAAPIFGGGLAAAAVLFVLARFYLVRTTRRIVSATDMGNDAEWSRYEEAFGG